MKTLISWIARQNDFNKGEVNTTGPTYTFHKNHFRHDRHLLLATKDSETMLDFLSNKLKADFPDHNVETKINNTNHS